MKKIFFLTLISGIIFGQKIQFIELKNSIKDKKHIARSLTLIDRRADKNIGVVSHRKDAFEVKFEDENLEKLFSDWFSEDNKEKGSTDYFLMLEDLKVNDIPNERSTQGHLEMKVSTFFKRNDKFYFLNKFEISKDYIKSEHAYITRAIAARISSELANIVKKSYGETGFNIAISDNELENYEEVLSENLPIFNTVPLKDGVYTDYKSFAQQIPAKNLIVKKNNDGKIKGVKRTDDYDFLGGELFTLVDNGIAYKKTPTNFIEIEKDEKGYFIIASNDELFPQTNSATIAGAVMGGAIGGLIGGIIDAASSAARKKNAKYHRVGIDVLTGEYILPEDFIKSK